MDNLKQTLHNLLPQIVHIRHEIHAHPELAHEEIKTCALISDTLRHFGYEVQSGIAGSGVSAVLDFGKPGKTIALRADIDALPIQEETNVPYISKINGKMHACGHDGHTATLLAVAGALMQTKPQLQLPGKIKFIFQPAEETGTGAPALIKAGILDNPKVDAIFAYHNTPKSELGKLSTRDGYMMAGQDAFTVMVKGKGGHAAHINTVIDPIYISTLLVQAIQSIVSRFTAPAEAVLVSVTQVHGGTTYNVIPDEVMLNGTIRTLSKDAQMRVKDKFTSIVNGIVSTFGASATINFHNYFPPTFNHEKETALVFNTAESVLGKASVTHMPVPSMAAEDFSHYLEKVPGCFFMMGNGDHGAIHGAKYEFNDDLIPIAAEVMAEVAIQYLKN